MKVIIFCGGKGYRLREETEFRPKPLVEICGKPILWHIMKRYEKYGLTDFILCLGYKGEMIRQYFLNYLSTNNDVEIDIKSGGVTAYPHLKDNPPWKVTLVDTGQNAMTGARLKRVEKYIDTDFFMLTYGDGVANINLKQLLQFHKQHGKIGTVTGVHPYPRFGELIYERAVVKKFSEKPQSKDVIINGGFFVFNKKIFRYVTNSDSCTFEREPLEKLARDKELSYFRHTGFWHCLDTYRDMEHLNELAHTRPAPWET
ncbi:TPA: glucose-1-phosphate cytidylyltransferase [Patescibacteria group bacterium]|nr:MAG: glucose-1-phosphate cytidylyltransferase [Candidatus Gottesmanbacteria bacterium RIFCSPHIGHO2_01_FULL_43_15]OGG28053.1 MAG: glucose-1-phosphate cytidylyltransferase [Candidatus Gottesmanbacteria bacterium RIFCSPLOWO2_01_FULL_42_10]HCM38274.1 glucose-1-phosphate cytidylyltransferase [Patescibacteria group bacterium]